jgi:hypothetical protein
VNGIVKESLQVSKFMNSTIHWNVMPRDMLQAKQYLVLKIEAVHFSKISVNFDWTTWQHILEDSIFHSLCHEDVWGSRCIDPGFLDFSTSWR